MSAKSYGLLYILANENVGTKLLISQIAPQCLYHIVHHTNHHQANHILCQRHYNCHSWITQSVNHWSMLVILKHDMVISFAVGTQWVRTCLAMLGNILGIKNPTFRTGDDSKFPQISQKSVKCREFYFIFTCSVVTVFIIQ